MKPSTAEELLAVMKSVLDRIENETLSEERDKRTNCLCLDCKKMVDDVCRLNKHRILYTGYCSTCTAFMAYKSKDPLGDDVTELHCPKCVHNILYPEPNFEPPVSQNICGKKAILRIANMNFCSKHGDVLINQGNPHTYLPSGFNHSCQWRGAVEGKVAVETQPGPEWDEDFTRLMKSHFLTIGTTIIEDLSKRLYERLCFDFKSAIQNMQMSAKKIERRVDGSIVPPVFNHGDLVFETKWNQSIFVRDEKGVDHEVGILCVDDKGFTKFVSSQTTASSVLHPCEYRNKGSILECGEESVSTINKVPYCDKHFKMEGGL